MNQLCLAMDTSGLNTSLALLTPDGKGTVINQFTDARHNEVLVPLIDQLLKASNTSLSEINAICLTTGPGMFTSLRVGLSVAKGIALARNIPIKGVNTLQALALTASTTDPVLALIDARKQELFAALYHQNKPLYPANIIAPEKLPELIKKALPGDQSFYLAGDGAKIAQPFLKEKGANFILSDVLSPSPLVIGQIGLTALSQEGPDDPETLEPFYLRRTDAELKRTAV